MNRQFVCIICPNSCQLKVEYTGKKIMEIKGAQCDKGKEFVKNEITNPLRVFLGSVKVIRGDFRLLSVKSATPIPKKYLKIIGKMTHALKVDAPVEIGQVIAKNLLNENIDLIATRKIFRKDCIYRNKG